MKWLKYGLIGLVELVVVVVVVGYILPGTYRVERSMEIAAPPEKVFALLNDPRAWAKWTVWNERDPLMKVTYSGAPSGAGAKWAWESKTEGTGAMEFSRVEANRLLEYQLTFVDFNSTSTGALALAPAGAGTRVTWSNAGKMAGPIGSYFALLMDRMVGPDFEGGLKNLKALAERG